MAGRSRARWGWYRLADPFAFALVERAGLGPGDLVLELGAGDGAITRHLAATRARVIAVELHPERVRRLRAVCSDTNVKVVRADIADLRLPNRPYHVVANPPFEGISAVLRRLTAPAGWLVSAELVLPLAVARRWSTESDARRATYRMRSIEPLPRSAFTPRPRIDCCVVTLDRR